LSRKLRPDPKVSGAKKTPGKWQREQQVARILRIVIPLAIALVVILVGVWGYDNYVGAWSQRVAQVNDTSINMSHFVKMLRLYRTTEPAIVDPWEVLRVIEENELIRQEATGLGLTVSPEDVTAEIARSFAALLENIEILEPDSVTVVVGNDSSANTGNGTSDIDIIGPAPTPTEDPSSSPEEIGDSYRLRLERLRLSDAEYRRVVETSLLSEALRENFARERTPEEAEHVYLHMLPLSTEEAANDVLDRLEGGEDFAALAGELSIVEEIKEAGGDVGWVPRGVFVQMDQVAFGLPVGNVSDPIPTSEGYYLLKVSGKSESMPVIDEYRSLLGDGVFVDWLQEQRQANVVEYLSQSNIEWALDHVE
jgi:hypothetical protein